MIRTTIVRRRLRVTTSGSNSAFSSTGHPTSRPHPVRSIGARTGPDRALRRENAFLLPGELVRIEHARVAQASESLESVQAGVLGDRLLRPGGCLASRGPLAHPCAGPLPAGLPLL